MRRTIHCLLLIPILLLAACSDMGDCFHGSGKQVTESRSIGSFHSIYLTSNVNLVLHFQPGIRRLEVTGGDRLTEGVETKIENGQLSVKNTNRCNWVRSFKQRLTVEIWTDSLQSIYLEDATGDVTFKDTLATENFRFDAYNSMGRGDLLLHCYIATLALHTGPFDLTAKGTATVQYNYHAGYGKNDCRELVTANAFLTNKGTNDTYISTSQLLEVNIQQSGNIYYRGEPASIKTEITGTGKLIKL